MHKTKPVKINGLYSFCLLSLLFLSFQVSGQVSFHGNSKVSGMYRINNNPDYYLPDNYLRLDINSRLNLWGIPLSGQVFLTTEENPRRQNPNRFRLYLNYNQLLQSKVFRKIPGLKMLRNLEIGNSIPNYSPLVLSGVSMNGINAEINPGFFYIAYARGVSKRKIGLKTAYIPEHQQKINYARFGFGNRITNHLHFSVLHVKDQADDGMIDSLFIHPKENHILSIDTRLNALRNKLFLAGEASLSLFTPNQNSQDLDFENMPSMVNKIIHPKLGSHVDYAYRLHSGLNLKMTRLSFEMKKVNPGYKSLGTSYLRSDLIETSAKLHQYLFERKLHIHAFIKSYRDNLSGQKSSGSRLLSWGIQTSLRLPKLPVMSIRYSPSTQKSMNEVYSYKNQLSMLNGSISYSKTFKDIQTNTQLMVSHRKNAITASYDVSEFKNTVLSLRENIRFAFPFSLSGNFAVHNISQYQEKYRMLITGLNFTYGKPDKINTRLGIHLMSRKDYHRKVNLHLSCSIPIKNIGKLEVSINQAIYKTIASPQAGYYDHVFKISLHSSW